MNSPRPSTVRWMEMLPEELLQAIAARPVCYMAYGLAEPHGVYNALGLDWLKAQGLCERAAETHGGVVAPPFAWHICERPAFPWMESHGVTQSLASSIPSELFYKMVLYQIRAFDARGFHSAVLITGHYGGIEHDLRLVCEHYLRRTGSPMRIWAGADWELMTYGKIRGDHAGLCETSQLMAIRPELVDVSRKESESTIGRWVGTDFPLPDGTMPSAELGEKIVAAQIESLGKIAAKLLSEYQPRPNWVAPTLSDVEAIWTRFEHATRKYWVCSRTLEEYMKGPHPVFPGWEALGE